MNNESHPSSPQQMFAISIVLLYFSDGSDLFDDKGDDAKSVKTNDDSKK